MDKASELFGSREAARQWLYRPAMALNRQIPRDLIGTADGRRIVATLLEQLDYGVYI